MLGPVPRGCAIHVDAKLRMEKMDGKEKIYGASFSGAYGTEGTKLAVNAQLELPLNDEVSDPFTVWFLLLTIYNHFTMELVLLFSIQLCIEGGGHYPRFPSLDRRTLIETPLEAVWNGKVGFGDSCFDHEITINVISMTRQNFESNRKIYLKGGIET